MQGLALVGVVACLSSANVEAAGQGIPPVVYTGPNDFTLPDWALRRHGRQQGLWTARGS
ncbi:hypothetical protein [Pseudoclavibacter sp. VKM Ac-2867]|uniref:hypothetical protein n=1 Tax=Pseudoclavibacter sp. VKM Ac-2867 TaxID=2783829 RepID=UPI00188C3012|nr:hypothetical protein [Pseudoclavibacter sp. VKM Ac-2867]MBF4460516.1 hypothetical protein [Pseudoclavibacter sp. VKM Ac-2867]